MLDAHHDTSDRPDLQADEVFGPELAFLQFSSCADEHVSVADRLGGTAIVDPFERDLPTLVGAPEGTDHERLVTELDLGTDLEVDQVGLVYIEAEKTVESMGAAQPGDPDGISRRTQGRR